MYIFPQPPATRDTQPGFDRASPATRNSTTSRWEGHHRCYRNEATERFLLLGRDGIEFVDPKTGKDSVSRHGTLPSYTCGI
jgi:hypothetical protein